MHLSGKLASLMFMKKSKNGRLDLSHGLLNVLTKYGDPSSWSTDEELVYVAQMRKALTDPRIHAHQHAKRIWSKSPLPEEGSRLRLWKI
ncbi:hypothetical protein N7450_000312 [Penicillium hetheringtonii]|uniref:Uncharacterized protein n=1 Tax=Penicillium hetheringtonii TaxID=911720 RepID=A0AAD6E351_9EURO|nr:hypothetical protein N7450_000312 [Penicillium hetheringtonii]